MTYSVIDALVVLYSMYVWFSLFTVIATWNLLWRAFSWWPSWVVTWCWRQQPVGGNLLTVWKTTWVGLRLGTRKSSVLLPKWPLLIVRCPGTAAETVTSTSTAKATTTLCADVAARVTRAGLLRWSGKRAIFFFSIVFFRDTGGWMI